MRHKPALTPTARLIVKAVSESSTPLSHANIAETTNVSPYTVATITQALVKKGLLRRNRVSGMSYFTSPVSSSEVISA